MHMECEANMSAAFGIHAVLVAFGISYRWFEGIMWVIQGLTVSSFVTLSVEHCTLLKWLASNETGM